MLPILDTDPHCDEKHEKTELLVAVLQGVPQALKTSRMPRKLRIL